MGKPPIIGLGERTCKLYAHKDPKKTKTHT